MGFFNVSARQQHRPQRPEGGERLLHHQLLHQGRGLRLQHREWPQRPPNQLLRLAAVRRTRALQGQGLQRALLRRLGVGHPAVLHGDGHHAVPRGQHGQAEALHPPGGLQDPRLRVRPVPAAHQGHAAAGAGRPLLAQADYGQFLAEGDPVP